MIKKKNLLIKERLNRLNRLNCKYINLINKSLKLNCEIPINNNFYSYLKIQTIKNNLNKCVISGSKGMVNRKYLINRFNYNLYLNKRKLSNYIIKK